MNTYTDESSSGAGSHTWEGVFGGKKYRVNVDRAPDKTHVHFEGPVDEAAGANAGKAFDFEWERGKGARTYGEYDEQLRELGAKAEKLARQAAEQAQDYAQQAANKVRETDWEGVGREVRSASHRAMSELEDAFSRVRSGWDGGQGGSSPRATGRARNVCASSRTTCSRRRRRIARLPAASTARRSAATSSSNCAVARSHSTRRSAG